MKTFSKYVVLIAAIIGLGIFSLHDMSLAADQSSDDTLILTLPIDMDEDEVLTEKIDDEIIRQDEGIMEQVVDLEDDEAESILIEGDDIVFEEINDLAVSDTTPPRVLSVLMDQTEAKFEEIISFHLQVKEEETGIIGIGISLSRLDGKPGMIGTTEWYQDEEKYTGQIDFTCQIDEGISPGIYYISRIEIRDASGNITEYRRTLTTDGSWYPDEFTLYADDTEDGRCQIIENTQIQIENEKYISVPYIRSFAFGQSSIKAGETFDITLDIDGDDINGVWITLMTVDGKQFNRCVYMAPEPGAECPKEGNQYIFHVSTDAITAAGDYYLARIVIRDTNNEREYRIEGDFSEKGYRLVENVDETDCEVGTGQLLTISSDIDPNADTGIILNSVKIRESSVTRPGVVHVDMDVTCRNGFSQVAVDMYLPNGSMQNLLFSPQETYDTNVKVTATMPVGRDIPVGTYTIATIVIYDQLGFSEEIHGENLPAQSVLIEDEFDIAFDVGLNKGDLLSLIRQLKDGETGRINYSYGSNKIAKKQVFEAIMGRNVKLEFYGDFYSWIFDGRDITMPKDIALDVSVDFRPGTAFGVDYDLLEMNFPNNGVLPGKAQYRIKQDYISTLYNLTGKLYIYYENETTGTLDYESKSTPQYVFDDVDSWCYFNITHNSSYLLSGTTIKKKFYPGEIISDTTSGLAYKVIDTSGNVMVSHALNKNKTSVIIPASFVYQGSRYTVVEISENAFINMKKLTSVSIGNNVRRIRSGAFKGCKKLKSLKIGSSVTRIDNQAFSGCEALKKVTIPSKVSMIGSKAFYNCKKLKSLKIGSSVTKIGKQAFSGCKALKKVTIPSKVLVLGSEAFYNCSNLKTVTIESFHLTKNNVGKKAFGKTNKFAKVRVPKAKFKDYMKILKKMGFSKKTKYSKM